MISDAIHSASDVFSTVVVMIGIKLASKKADKEHPYGHERMECVADAWHHRSDALSSVGALVGIGGAMLGFPVMDAVASLVIFVFIVKAVYDIFKDAMDKMVDHSCDAKTEKQIYDCIIKHPEVVGIDMLHTRIFGNKIYVDVEILVDGTYTLQHAHNVAEEVHDDIEQNFPKVKHIMVHVNPAE